MDADRVRFGRRPAALRLRRFASGDPTLADRVAEILDSDEDHATITHPPDTGTWAGRE